MNQDLPYLLWQSNKNVARTSSINHLKDHFLYEKLEEDNQILPGYSCYSILS